MDIKEWLQNTVYREPPEDQEGFPNGPQPQLGPSKPVRTGHRHKRRRASSDPPADGLGRRDLASSDHVQLAAASFCSDSTSRHGGSGVSSRERVPIKVYEKRARHKTKPDRYEYKPKKGKEEHEPKKSKSKRQKRDRTADGARTTGIVQSFQLKNGPKSNRLTLRPEATAGIFNHGKASAPMAASGPGLPDLVFNEMKFLSKPKECREESSATVGIHKSKKGRKELREEEISAYFRNITAKRRAGERDQLEQASGALKQAHPTIETVTRASERVDDRHHDTPVALPEKAFLGFGSRGAPQAGRSLHSPGKSYFTWSESIAAPKRASLDDSQSMPPRPPSREACPARREEWDSLNMTTPRQRRSQHRQDRLIDGEARRRAHLASIGQEQQIGLGDEPAPQPRSSFTKHARYVRNALRSTASVPPAEPRATNKPGVPIKHQSCEAGNCRTSDILQLRDCFHTEDHSASLPRHSPVYHATADQENVDPTNSTPTSKLLRDAWAAISRPQQEPWSCSMKESAGLRYDDAPQLHPSVAITAPTCQQLEAGLYHEHQQPPPQPAWFPDEEHIPQRGFSRAGTSHAAQYRQPLRSVSASNSNGRPRPQPTPLAQYATGRVQQRATVYEMPDIQPKAPIYVNRRQAEDLVRQLASDRMPERHVASDLHAHQQGYYNPSREFSDAGINDSHPLGLQNSLEMPYLVTEPPSMQMENPDGGYHSEIPMMAPLLIDSEPADGMAGFWQPNMLY